jgi:hypothetical protein
MNKETNPQFIKLKMLLINYLLGLNLKASKSNITYENAIDIILFYMNDYDPISLDLGIDKEKYSNSFLSSINFPYLITTNYDEEQLIYFICYFILKTDFPNELIEKSIKLNKKLQVALKDILLINENKSILLENSENIIYNYNLMNYSLKELKLSIDTFMSLTNKLTEFKAIQSNEFVKALKVEEIILLSSEVSEINVFFNTKLDLNSAFEKNSIIFDKTVHFLDNSRRLLEDIYTKDPVELLFNNNYKINENSDSKLVKVIFQMELNLNIKEYIHYKISSSNKKLTSILSKFKTKIEEDNETNERINILGNSLEIKLAEDMILYSNNLNKINNQTKDLLLVTLDKIKNQQENQIDFSQLLKINKMIKGDYEAGFYNLFNEIEKNQYKLFNHSKTN